MNPKTTDPFDRPLDHSSQYIDRAWDELGDDPIEDYTGRAGRLRDEDGSW